ncbi:MAG: sulfur oxidation c-type cytochrome SoxX [Gammaproteobacteria bacterium]|nr:sulfur oxidation c-type cytochrome SoxX [Gammaproteobacteria bacterium]
MRISARIVNTAASLAVLIGCLSLTAPAVSVAADADVVEAGKKIAFSKKKGNCLACHDIKGGKLPGNIGPPLIAMKARFKKEDLKNQISDARVKNKHTIMPPFGPHQILKADEIEKVVEFIYTL